jgi:hypothetical protein
MRISFDVDDSEGVRLEGEEHGFKVILLEPSDGEWVERVLDAADSLKKR